MWEMLVASFFHNYVLLSLMLKAVYIIAYKIYYQNLVTLKNLLHYIQTYIEKPCVKHQFLFH